MSTIYDDIGGAPAVAALVARFYDLVETAPEAARLRELHAAGRGLAQVRAEQGDFLSGFLGGPRLYEQRHGHMNLRRLHAHLPLGPAEAEAWLAIMARALDDTGICGPARARIDAAFARAAEVLAHRSEAGAGTVRFVAR